MPFAVYRTTAEHVIGATDAALQTLDGVTKEMVAEFLDAPEENADAALNMATQLGLLSEAGGTYRPCFPYATYLITSNRHERAAMLRFVLEQYPPYKTFRVRLALDGLAPQAATRTRALHSISAHRDLIVTTFTDLGTYANSLVSEGAGLIKPRDDEGVSFITQVGEVVKEREQAELLVRRRLGKQAAEWVHEDDVLAHLISAVQRLRDADEDAKPSVTHAGNAIESFLSQLANDQGVNLAGATGINSKAEKLSAAHAISKKHLNIFKYLGHLRNAADHGIDDDVGKTWAITADAAIEYVYVAHTAIRSSTAFKDGGRCEI